MLFDGAVGYHPPFADTDADGRRRVTAVTVYRNACVVPPSSLPSCPHCICSFLPSFLFDNCVIDEYRVLFGLF